MHKNLCCLAVLAACVAAASCMSAVGRRDSEHDAEVGVQWCSRTTYCADGSHCCTATTCCPYTRYCCGGGYYCCLSQGDDVSGVATKAFLSKIRPTKVRPR